MIFNTIEFLDSANKPLPVPDRVRLSAACGSRSLALTETGSAVTAPTLRPRGSVTLARLPSRSSCDTRTALAKPPPILHTARNKPLAKRRNRPEAAIRGDAALVGRSADQCDHRRPAARRLLCRRDGRHFDLVRHPRHRQHRASGLHHPRLVHRLHRQPDARPRSDPDRDHRAAGVLRARRRGLSGLLRLVREARPGCAARARVLLRPAVRHRGAC